MSAMDPRRDKAASRAANRLLRSSVALAALANKSSGSRRADKSSKDPASRSLAGRGAKGSGLGAVSSAAQNSSVCLQLQGCVHWAGLPGCHL